MAEKALEMWSNIQFGLRVVRKPMPYHRKTGISFVWIVIGFAILLFLFLALNVWARFDGKPRFI